MAQVMDRARKLIEDDNEYVWYSRRYVWAIGALLLVIVALFLFRTTTSGDSHNVFQDVNIEECHLLDDGHLEATGLAVNHGSGTKDYDITVQFVVNANDAGENTTTVKSLRSDQSASWKVQVDAPATGALECKITAIDRH